MSAVYALVSSGEPDIVRYVGRTKHAFQEKRLASHRGHMKAGGTTHVYNWMRSVYASGHQVIAHVIESDLTWEEAGEREMHYIKFYRDSGYNLTNISLGGDGGAAMSQETKDLMSRNRKGKSPSLQAHAAARLANIGRAKTEEEKAKVSAANKGRVKTPEVCKRLSEIAKARPRRPHTQETKDKISKAKMGNVISKEAREKISKASRDRVVTLQTREKLSKAGKNRKHSQETREKMSRSSTAAHLHRKNLKLNSLKQEKEDI